jgi:hypothetical protein
MTTAIKTPFRSSFFGRIVLLFATVLLVASCATREKFTTSTVVPAAIGDVKVKKDDNNNYRVEISVENLAEPSRLPVPKSVYVVWAQTGGGSPQNLGQLRSSSGLFSSKLKAEMKTVTAYKPSRVFITAEDIPTAQYPSSYVILNTNSF